MELGLASCGPALPKATTLACFGDHRRDTTGRTTKVLDSVSESRKGSLHQNSDLPGLNSGVVLSKTFYSSALTSFWIVERSFVSVVNEEFIIMRCSSREQPLNRGPVAYCDREPEANLNPEVWCLLLEHHMPTSLSMLVAPEEQRRIFTRSGPRLSPHSPAAAGAAAPASDSTTPPSEVESAVVLLLGARSSSLRTGWVIRRDQIAPRVAGLLLRHTAQNLLILPSLVQLDVAYLYSGLACCPQIARNYCGRSDS